MHTRTLRVAVTAGALAIIAAACGSSTKSSNASSAPATTVAAGATPTTMEHMTLPSYTSAMKTAFTAPAANTTLTGNTLDVNVAATGYTSSCLQAGRAPKQGVGHYHLLLDKSLINMFCTSNVSVSMQNVKPGKHVLEVVPALNDHAEVMENAQVLPFDYAPTAPLPQISDSTSNGTPSIHIISPKSGTTVSGNFDVVVDIKNFTPSCALYGKPDLVGYGHWHLNFDTATGAMMGMGTMAGMSCTQVVHTSTAQFASGSTHKLIAILVGNGHAPLNPMISDSVSVTVG